MFRLTPLVVILCLSGMTFTTSVRADTVPPLDTVPFVEGASPAGSNSLAPCLSAGKSAIYMTWIEQAAGGSPVIRMSSNSGGEWSPPQTIVSDAGIVPNWADTPKILALDNGMLVVTWLHGRGDAAQAYDVEVITSTDGGVHWTSLGHPHRDKAQVEHGFVSLLPHAGDGFWIVWLDGRNHANVKPAASPGVGSHGANTELRAARWRPGSGWDAENKLDERVCDCCQTAAVVTLEGLAVAYRDRDPKETRDISLVRFERQQWSKPFSVRRDGWVLDGCPVNGPALAWYTNARETSETYVALSDSSSFGLSRVIKIDDGRPLGRVDVEWLRDESALVTWIEQTSDTGAELRAKRVTIRGDVSPSKVLAQVSSGRSSGFPQLALRDIDIWLAWTAPEGDGTKVKVGKLDLKGSE